MHDAARREVPAVDDNEKDQLERQRHHDRRQQHLKAMRMTRQETKEEFRQSEGDPHVKQRLRQIRQERVRTRMMQAVPEADVVVTNPTHYAVALQYKPEEMQAPRLVAKGVGSLAQSIRETAEAHDIAIIENPPPSPCALRRC